MCVLDATYVNRSRRLVGRVQGQASTLDALASYARASDEISAAVGDGPAGPLIGSLS